MPLNMVWKLFLRDIRKHKPSVTFLDHTRLAVSFCGKKGILTLEAGSSFEYDTPCDRIILQQGAEWIEQEGQSKVVIKSDTGIVRVDKSPGERCQMYLSFQVPENNNPPQEYKINVRQLNIKQTVVGGLAFVGHISAE